jgi:predicted N-acetyltransferase YhbS
MDPSDLDFCVRAVEAEGWQSETRYTFETFLAHNQSGCFIAEERDQPVGMCVATPYETCGFLGELIVIPKRRGHGIGGQVMRHAIKYLQEQDCRSIYLDGDTLAVPLYERLGFRVICKSLRFVGRIEGSPSESVRTMRPDDLEIVLRLDREAFGADRAFFLRRRFESFPQFCMTLETDKHVAGFIMGQPGRGVVTVGPWLINDPTRNPLDLIRGVALKTGNTRLRLAILETNTGAAALCRSLNTFEETEPSWRMAMGSEDNLGMSARLLALGSPSKG